MKKEYNEILSNIANPIKPPTAHKAVTTTIANIWSEIDPFLNCSKLKSAASRKNKKRFG